MRELIAWNLVSQSYVALEAFCATFSALRAARDDPSRFAFEYLRFGRNEPDLRGPNVMATMDSLAGKDASRSITDALGIPMNLEDVARVGLDGCGIDPTLLVRAGRHTRDIVVTEFRRLASAFIGERDVVTGRPLKSVPAKAYGAFRHGFAAGYPLHSPKGAIIHDDPQRFATETAFMQFYAQAQSMAEILYLDEKKADGTRAVEHVMPPVYTSQLKPFVQITYWATKWTYEIAKYAQSLFGSVGLQFPYLVNSAEILGDVGRASLQKRLDDLEAR